MNIKDNASTPEEVVAIPLETRGQIIREYVMTPEGREKIALSWIQPMIQGATLGDRQLYRIALFHTKLLLPEIERWLERNVAWVIVDDGLQNETIAQMTMREMDTYAYVVRVAIHEASSVEKLWFRLLERWENRRWFRPKAYWWPR